MKFLKAGIVCVCLLILGKISLEYFVYNEKDRVSHALSKIPFNEQVFLDYLFRDLLLRQGGGYVLNGSKPVALGDFEPPSLERMLFFGSHMFTRQVLLNKGYEIWKKYEHLFPSLNFALLCQEDRENNVVEVILINKKRFFQEVEANIEDFRDVLGMSVTPELLLKALIREKKLLFDALKHHSGLLGMILGFGKHNSFLFYQRETLQYKIDDYQFIPKKTALFEKDLNIINRRFHPLMQKRKNKLLFASFPNFVFDPYHPETHILLEKYKEQRIEVTKIYREGNFLETALKNFIS